MNMCKSLFLLNFDVVMWWPERLEPRSYLCNGQGR